MNPSVIPRRTTPTACLCNLAWLSLTNVAGKWHRSHFVFITKAGEFSFGGWSAFSRRETADDCRSYRWTAAWHFSKAAVNRDEAQFLADSSITKYGNWFCNKLAFMLGWDGFILSPPTSYLLHSLSHSDPLSTMTRPATLTQLAQTSHESRDVTTGNVLAHLQCFNRTHQKLDSHPCRARVPKWVFSFAHLKRGGYLLSRHARKVRDVVLKCSDLSRKLKHVNLRPFYQHDWRNGLWKMNWML